MSQLEWIINSMLQNGRPPVAETQSLEILDKNLECLRRNHPNLIELVSEQHNSDKYSVEPSRSGLPTASAILNNGQRKSLHSTYDPAAEAKQFIDSCDVDQSINFLVNGIGLGYHLIELVKRVPPEARILIIEKDLELFNRALSNVDMTTLLDHPGITFWASKNRELISAHFEKEKFQFALMGFKTITLNSLMERDRDYYESINQDLNNAVQETQIYQRTLEAFSKTYYKNIIGNIENLIESAGINSLANCFQNLPAIIISAGPSLDKNINFLKGAQSRAILIAVSTAFQPLMKCGIEPDFVIAIDPNEVSIMAFDLESPPKSACLVYDPCIPKEVPLAFGKNRLAIDSNIFISQWVARFVERKGSLGNAQSVAHTALAFARHLGCSPVILTGQDLSFDRQRLHCSDSHFNESHRDSADSSQTVTDLEQSRYQASAPSFTPTLDMFGKATLTTQAMDSFKNILAKGADDSFQVLNATEGGVPIPGVRNLLLREAITLYCKKNIAREKQTFLRNLNSDRKSGNLAKQLSEQANRFNQLHQMIKDIIGRYPASPSSNKTMENFFNDFQSIHQTMASHSDTLDLLQDYMFSAFAQWNRETCKINLEKSGLSETAIAKKKMERDWKFLCELEESADFLRSSFEKMSKRLSANHAGSTG